MGERTELTTKERWQDETQMRAKSLGIFLKNNWSKNSYTSTSGWDVSSPDENIEKQLLLGENIISKVEILYTVGMPSTMRAVLGDYNARFIEVFLSEKALEDYLKSAN